MKTKIHKITTVAFSIFIALAVLLTATHAKDIVSAQPVKTKARVADSQVARTTDDPVQKAISDLHNHSDKTMLKNFAKSISDAPALAAKRSEKDEHTAEDQPISMRLFEAFFMMQLAFAYARS